MVRSRMHVRQRAHQETCASYRGVVIDQDLSYAKASAAAARIDELLHRSSGTAPDGTMWACVREQPFRLPAVQRGVSYRSVGGHCRLYAA